MQLDSMIMARYIASQEILQLSQYYPVIKNIIHFCIFLLSETGWNFRYLYS